MVLWDEIASEVASEFPDVTWDKMLVDAMTMRMTLKPATLDTIVATNLHADILSDLAAALAGSLGIANPIATFWTACMMLDHLGEQAASATLMRAIERVTADPSLHTPDLGGHATTFQVTEAVKAAIRTSA